MTSSTVLPSATDASTTDTGTTIPIDCSVTPLLPVEFKTKEGFTGSEDFAFDDGAGHHTLGMVGTGAMNRMMILAKPDLLSGFRNAADKRNVGLHEFAHLVDKSDGAFKTV